MSNYDFETIQLRKRTVQPYKYTVPISYGILLGFVTGFFITLGKSPPFILMDSLYGSMLGLLLVIAYNLFAMSVQVYEEIEEEAPLFHNRQIYAMYLELTRERDRLSKQQQQQQQGPVAQRTRSKTRTTDPCK